MPCCTHCKATEAHFGPQIAERDVKRYRRRGPDASTRLLLEMVAETDLRDAHLLDVGGGIGVLHHELLGKTVTTVTHVEAAPAYIQAARQEDERRGWQGRIEYLTGDVLDLTDALPAADLVTLDRVICCYPDWEPLVRRTADRAGRFYAHSIPHDRWYVRVGMALENFLRRLRGNAFRTFVHPCRAVEQLLAELGFRKRSVRSTMVWQVALYARGDAG